MKKFSLKILAFFFALSLSLPAIPVHAESQDAIPSYGDYVLSPTETDPVYALGDLKGVNSLQTKSKAKKYVNPISSIYLGSTKLSGKVFQNTNQYNKLKYAKYANKSHKLTVKLKKDWKLQSIYYQKKGWSSSEAKRIKNGSKVSIKGGSGFQIRITAVNKKARLQEKLYLTLTGKSVPDTSKPTPAPSQTELYKKEVLKLVNKERAKAGIKPLKADPTLEKAAAIRAKELTKVFDHVRPNGSICFTVLDDVGASYYVAAENIAAGQKNPNYVMDAWMNSPGHRSNILNGSFGKIGVGYYKTPSGSPMWVQLFTN